nr:hypothetical protein [Brevibacterium ravenspurgense]
MERAPGLSRGRGAGLARGRGAAVGIVFDLPDDGGELTFGPT